ncbi:ATP-binding protein [Porifericola rhodea]|uniref:sensor histidine kinase n=1 Tax=Porifericola rhodea TaxID=930972 RepID=UPI0026652E06|nr:ATP-binding protein [Porifericola rhodea]WKN31036.1 ATP-binding protein [Porifericola rhodea]
MIFNRFEWALLVRILLLSASMLLCLYFIFYTERIASGVIISLLVTYQIYELYQYVLETNRKLTRFLEAVKYSDFTAGFNRDSKLGESFGNLNRMFNEVFDAFRKARAEKEEHWQYLKTVVQHVNVGLLSYDESGNIELVNNTAKKFLRTNQLNKIGDLARVNYDLYQIINQLPPGSKTLFKPSPDLHLSINATELRLRGNTYKLVSIQNILSELQQQEIEAWQNLTKVLRHEIMNSITPIASLAGTAIDIIHEDVVCDNGMVSFNQESYDDITMSLRTIENRTKGLVTFVEAYRNFTSIPQPEFERVRIDEIIKEVVQLVKVGIAKENARINVNINPPQLIVRIDPRLIEMVLINLLKNACEAMEEIESPVIDVTVYTDHEQRVFIEITDNGPGIEPEALEKIFIPFYTTKNHGSGIGLSLSQRIMQMHHGNLTARSVVGSGTTFTLQI